MTETHAKIHTLARASLLLALVIVLGLFPGIPLGIIPVAIVLQNLGVMLVGALLPARVGTLVMAVFFILVAVGLPLLSGGRGGIAVFAGPTAGYLLGWLLVPVTVQLGFHYLGRGHFVGVLLALIFGGVLLVDLLGALGLVVVNGMPLAMALWSNLAFLPGDLIKAVVAALVTVRLQRLLAN